MMPFTGKLEPNIMNLKKTQLEKKIAQSNL